MLGLIKEGWCKWTSQIEQIIRRENQRTVGRNEGLVQR